MTPFVLKFYLLELLAGFSQGFAGRAHLMALLCSLELSFCGWGPKGWVLLPHVQGVRAVLVVGALCGRIPVL